MALTTTQYQLEYRTITRDKWLPCDPGSHPGGVVFDTETDARAAIGDTLYHRVVEVTTTRRSLPEPPKPWAVGQYRGNASGTLAHVVAVLADGTAIAWWTRGDARTVDFIHASQAANYTRLQEPFGS